MMHKKMALATYLAKCGVCSRRKADALVRQGQVLLNGQVILEPATPVEPGDLVHYQDKLVILEQKAYILLNKPLNCLSAVIDQEYGRQTVLDLVAGAANGRLYPVGRLDYQTTGLIIITNDGDLAQKLAHPKYEIIKTYQVKLDKNFKEQDLLALKRGVYLEDGLMRVDDVYYANPNRGYQILNVVIHSGKNRIVRRLFAHLGYQVIALDRIEYAGLTKGQLKSGQWRFLTEQEILSLKN